MKVNNNSTVDIISKGKHLGLLSIYIGPVYVNCEARVLLIAISSYGVVRMMSECTMLSPMQWPRAK